MGITTSTIIRTIILALALINQILVTLGKSPIPISDEQVEQIISLGFTIIASLWTYWKNNSITSAAIAADIYMEELKNKDN